ncbi:MAG TPA: DUF6599 family protein [Thermoanaerobaculia bacterium]|jgi:hypothetical protein|nr:DUF6599 family protein [Thermoanaerobaculia bacterium]
MGTSGYSGNGVRRGGDAAGSTRRDRSGRARHHRLSAFALIAILAVACSRGTTNAPTAPPRAAEPEVDFTAIDSPSLQFLPRHEEAKGWRLEEDPMVVPGDRLGTYLGADGQHFLRYEVVDVTAGKYIALDGQGFATVEIFRFPDFVKAFGAYSMRKEAARRFLPIDNEAYVSKFAVHLWRGPFYVRVTGGARNAFESLTGLAAFVAERMPPAPSKPAVFNFFPNDVRVPNSERYSADEGFGQHILGNSFQAKFNVGGEIHEGLIIPSANRAAATKILNAYRDLYVRNGKLLDPIPNLGEDNFTAEDKYLGRAVAFRIDRFVIAFNGYKDRQKVVDLAVATDAKMLGSIRKQLVAADKAKEDANEPRNPDADRRLPWQRPQ